MFYISVIITFLPLSLFTEIWIIHRYKQLQLSSDVKFAEIYSECNLRSFELERVQLVLEERKSDLKRSMLENDKAVKQKEVCL